MPAPDESIAFFVRTHVALSGSTPMNDNERTPANIGRLRARRIIRDVLPVAALALADHHPERAPGDAEALLEAALAVIDGSMPPELQVHDKRMVAAEELLRELRARSR